MQGFCVGLPAFFILARTAPRLQEGQCCGVSAEVVWEVADGADGALLLAMVLRRYTSSPLWLEEGLFQPLEALIQSCDCITRLSC